MLSEEDNTGDRHAVIVTKLNSHKVMGQLPREICTVACYFLKHKGEITSKVTGRRKHSRIVQGGIEIPARLKLYQPKTEY